MLSSTSPILVTGVSGFIGYSLTLHLLKKGFTVVGVDNLNEYYDISLKQARLENLTRFSQFKFYQANIADRAHMQQIWEHNPSIMQIVHLAAQAGVRYSLTNPFAYIEANIMGHMVILELARHREGFQHFIYASSSSVYGGNTKLPFSVEDRCDTPVSLYAATKKADELMTQSYAHLYRIPSTGLRFFTVYGPWGRPDMAVFLFTKAIITGHPIQVFNYGKMKRDFTYIDDIVKGIIGALNAPPKQNTPTPPHKVYNLGNNKSEKLLDFIHCIEESLGKKAILEMLPLQAGDVPESLADITTAERDLSYSPTTPISQGIPQFVEWYKEYYKV
jgi:UDP-glucuronate 4-epimerase